MDHNKLNLKLPEVWLEGKAYPSGERMINTLFFACVRVGFRSVLQSTCFCFDSSTLAPEILSSCLHWGTLRRGPGCRSFCGFPIMYSLAWDESVCAFHVSFFFRRRALRR